ncbi:MAG TPA: hypothetical protein VGC30_07665 [Dokdonella sp.]
MKKFGLLLKREYWEHRGGFLWTPVSIAASIVAITVLGILSAELFSTRARINVGFSLDTLRGHIDANDLFDAGRGLDMAQLTFAGIVGIGLFFVTFFYLLGALYDDRRDRSVLFWKSLPVSDLETVAAKALTAALVVPAIALAVATLAYAAFVAVVCAWAGLHGVNALPAVLAAHPFGMLLRLVATLPIGALWALPTVGWLLFWSAYARSKPFLWAVMLPVVALIANWWVALLGGPHVGNELTLAGVLGRLLFSVMPGSWIASSGSLGAGLHVPLPLGDDPLLAALVPAHAYQALTTWNLWLGVAGGVVLLAGATWLRGRRIETAT